MASRAYRIRQGEPLAREIRRIARGRIDHALDELRGKTDSTPEEAVHEARKDMKKLRALLRLVREEVGDKTYRRESTCFRDAGRELAGVRDADVMLETLRSLEERYPEDVPPDAAGGLRQALEGHRSQVRGQASETAIEMLVQARGRVAGWPLESDDFAALEPGLRRIYRRGRRDWRAARDEPTAEHVHEWRKRVKDLWYHASLLEESWKPVMSALSDEAHELSNRLGDDHDLTVLVDWAHEHATALGSMDRVYALETMVQRRRAELQAEALAYGERLYADKPKAFSKRIGRWWSASSGAARAEATHH